LKKRLGELVGKKRKSGKRNCWNSKKKSQKLTPHGNSSIQKLLQIKTNLENAGVTTIKELEEKIASIQTEFNQLDRERQAAEAEFTEIEQLRSQRP